MRTTLVALGVGNVLLLAFLFYLLVRLRSLRELKDRLSDRDRGR